MDEAAKFRAAAAWRRSHMPWDEIAHRVGIGKTRLRLVLTKQGLADGWGEGSLIRGDGGRKAAKNGLKVIMGGKRGKLR